MVDEFDLLVTPKQKVIYDLLTWAHHKNAKLIVIAIANTMNLPSTLTPKVQSRLGKFIKKKFFCCLFVCLLLYHFFFLTEYRNG